MNKRGAGVIFCLNGCLLVCTRYIIAGIYMLGSNVWSDVALDIGLNIQGEDLVVLSVLNFLIGMIYMAFGEIDEYKKNNKSESFIQ